MVRTEEYIEESPLETHTPSYPAAVPFGNPPGLD